MNNITEDTRYVLNLKRLNNIMLLAQRTMDSLIHKSEVLDNDLNSDSIIKQNKIVENILIDDLRNKFGI